MVTRVYTGCDKYLLFLQFHPAYFLESFDYIVGWNKIIINAIKHHVN